MIILENSTVLLQTIYLSQDGVAVRIEASSGQIAVAYGNEVLILKPIVFYNRPTTWEKYSILKETEKITCLSWSSDREIVIGSINLSLWELPGRLLWQKKLANAVKQVEVSPDSCLIASIAEYDSLVKVWRRVSFDIENAWFDFVYLPHPMPVLELRWKRPLHHNQTIENTLYTIGKDSILRIWSPYDHMDSANLQLWSSIDMNDDGQHGDHLIFPFVVDNGELTRAVESSIAREETNEVARIGGKQAELCIIVDSEGHLTIYSIENVGLAKKQKLAKVVKMVKSKVDIDCLGSQQLVFKTFSHLPSEPNDLSVLVHDLTKGVLFHYTLDLNKLLAGSKHWHLKSILTGHNKSVQSIMRADDGQYLLSQSRFEENSIWRPRLVGHGVTMNRSSIIRGRIKCAALMRGGRYVITILDKSLDMVLWDCKYSKAIEITRIKVEESEEPLAFFLLPESDPHVLHLIAVYSSTLIKLYTVNLEQSTIKSSGIFGLPINDEEEKLKMAAVVDPVGWKAKLTGKLDEFERDVMLTISSRGTMRLWTAHYDQDEKLNWLQTSMVETGQTDISKAQVSSTKKVVTTNTSGDKLFIWDMRNKLLEFEENFADDRVKDLDWTSSQNELNVLGIGFERQVMLYCQLRFDYTNKSPSWAPFKQLDISQFTSHPIGDSIWLRNGTFVVGAGNQFFIQDNKVDVSDPTTKELLGSRNTALLNQEDTIFDICAVLNGPLPLYHPQLLIQSVFANKTHVVKRILVTLLNKLKFSVVTESNGTADIKANLGLKDVFDENNPDESDNTTPAGSTYEKVFRRDSITDEQVFDEQVCEQLGEWIQRVSLPYLTRHQQITLASVIEAIHQTDLQRRSLDENGAKYLLGFKLFKIHRGTQESMTMRDFNWALHSESQDILQEIVEKAMLNTKGQKVLFWPQLREVGFPYWLSNNKLVEQIEKLAKNYFSHDGKRDPIACSLYYLALHKKTILTGLWRTASWHPEQAKTIKLLQNDFAQPRWRSAALKNAFALLGKHRFEYAAAFFLLGDSLKDAVNVLVKQIEDVSLAIAVARVYEGDNGPVFKNLVHQHILPQAEKTGDRWTASWAYWTMGEKMQAVKCLAHMPDVSTNTITKSFLVDDPVLVLLYRYLRDSSLKKTDSGGTLQALDVDDEFQFVLKMASIYSRMGCDVLALDLIRSWRFVLDERRDTKKEKEAETPRQPTLSRATTQTTGEELFNEKSDANVGFNLKPVSVQAFQEPDMSAFNFGF